jgi:hypothetical protein
MVQHITAKPMYILIALGLSLTMIGCNQPENRATVLPSNQSANAQPATTESAPTPVITASERETAATTDQSPKTSTTNIPPGRYWIGSTDQALDVEGERYRYLDAEGEQPWRSASDLQTIKSGVIYDGQNYWCLSTMAPKSSGAIACSENGWVTAMVSAERKLLFSCATTDTKQILLYDSGKTIDYRFGKIEYPLERPPQFVSELDLKVPRAEVGNQQWSGFGRNMIYSVAVPNGNVLYRVFWSLDKLDKTHTPEGGVEVIENGTSQL